MEKIIYENEKGMKVELKNSRPFILTKIDGIGGLNNDIVETRVPFQDGSSYNNSRLEPRVITIYGGIMGKDKANRFARREELIRVFNPKMEGKLIYKNDYLERSIDCRVESGPNWNNGVKRLQEFMLQLYCNNPFFFDLVEDKNEIATWIGGFEFPLEIPIATGIKVGYRESNLVANIVNKGDVDCGMRIEFEALGTVVAPSITNINTREFVKINRSLSSGDKIIVQTGFGNNRIELINSNGKRENAMHYIDHDSTFIKLDIGDNLLRYDTVEGIDNLNVTIYHKPMYLGV